MTLTLQQKLRLLSYIRTSHSCWNWCGPVQQRGSRGHYVPYGSITLNSKTQGAHRVVYEYFKGPIPKGLHLDHLCRNTLCVKPTHLEPVTPRENILRGIGIPARNSRKTHCKRGHPFDEKNTYRTSRGRHCIACQRRREAAHYMRRKNLDANQPHT